MYKSTLLALALVSRAIAQDPTTTNESIASVLATALPESLIDLAYTNAAAASSAIVADFADGAPPPWYTALPSDIQSYLVPVQTVYLTSFLTPSPTAAPSPSSTPTTPTPTPTPSSYSTLSIASSSKSTLSKSTSSIVSPIPVHNSTATYTPSKSSVVYATLSTSTITGTGGIRPLISTTLTPAGNSASASSAKLFGAGLMCALAAAFLSL